VGQQRLKSRPLPRAFYDRPVLAVAPDLLGALVVRDGVTLRLTEVEAYDGANDPASHAYRGQTARNTVMFGRPGHAYVYFTYGMHFCVNLVCGPPDTAAAVLLRAGEIIDGADVVQRRRPRSVPRDYARGPARLTQALAIAREFDGVDVTKPSSPIVVRAGEPIAPERIRCGPRIGIAVAGERPWRFWVDGEPTVSAYRPHIPRRRAGS